MSGHEGEAHGQKHCSGEDACCGADSVTLSSFPAGGRAFHVVGMDCGEEVAALKREVGPAVGGVDRLGFDLMTGRMSVDSSANDVPDAAVIAAAARAGLTAFPLTAAGVPPLGWWDRHGRTFTTAASAALLLTGFAVHAAVDGFGQAVGLVRGEASLHGFPPATVVLYLLAVLAAYVHVLPRALLAARRLRPDMNLLMSVAVVGALAIGELLEAATVAFLFALSLVLESWSVNRARRAVRALLEVAPPTARLRDAMGGGERLVAPDEVPVGGLVIVHGGERIPLDGTVEAGRAYVDASPVTGEARPAAVAPGSEVFAGTIALDGALDVRTTRPASDTVLARVVRRVAEAGRRRAPVERWVDRFASVYTPAVFGTALLVALAPPLVLGAPWADWLYRALVLLVIGCPCALVISTPVSILAGLASAARHGVLVKGGDILERPGHIVALALDKTGTVTTGELAVDVVAPSAGHSENDVLRLAAALESRSTHPIARAIIAAARDRAVQAAPARAVRVVAGRGAEGEIDGELAWLGSERMLQERGLLGGDALPPLGALAAGGRTVVAVGLGQRPFGALSLRDRPRSGAARALAELREQGVERIVLLTGDNRETAEEVGRLVGVSEVRAGLLPDDKLAEIERLQRETAGGRRKGPPRLVGFVGDGINDGPSLARADVGIAMAAGGTDLAVETADVALLADDLSRIPWLVRHSRRVLAVIKANIAFALGVKAVFVVLTALGHASLWAAITADMGASLVVIANGLRLLRGSPVSRPLVVTRTTTYNL